MTQKCSKLIEKLEEKYRHIDFITEMSGLHPNYTKLKDCVRISTKEHSTGPRLKIFSGKSCKGGKNISIEINDDPQITEHTLNNEKYIDKKSIKQVKLLIKAYLKDLLIYWFDNDKIIDEEFVKKLNKFLRTGIKEDIMY